MSSDDLYTLVRDEFEPVHMRRSLPDIAARGRKLRRRRRGVTAVAAVGLAVALAAGVAPALRSGPAPKPPSSIELAAWSVDTVPDGSVVLTIRQLAHPEELTAALKKAGIPALVEFKKIGADARIVGCEDRQPALPQLNDVITAERPGPDGEERVFTIRPMAMPAGTSLHFVIFDEVSDTGTPARVVQMGLVQGDPVPCTLLK
ncbi:hypothetical protein [Actinoplanes sp. HUAS TT8]|uniref:hypothetical protein n=1 Tax=Actinoplanes sp. HUAS TT8 TaxID=3447453 RepID=UPI003F522D00